MLTPEVISHIRSTSLREEHTRIFDTFALETIIKQGWFKVFVPKALGGKQATLPEAMKIFEYAAFVDGSFGWITTIGAGGGFFAGYMQEKIAADIFSADNAVIAGSGIPKGVAKRVEGGYLVSGSWSYCSGAAHATTYTANCILEEHKDQADNSSAAAEPTIFAVALRPDQVEVVSDWKASGLKATHSDTINVVDQFVPDERTFKLIEQTTYLDQPIYRFPFVPFAQTTFVAISIGIAKHLLEEAAAAAKKHQTIWQPNRYSFVTNQIERVKLMLDDKVAILYETITDIWTVHEQGEPISEQLSERVSRACHDAAQTALLCGQQIMPYMGMSAIMEDEAINQIWRDLQTACQHSMLVAYE